MFHAGSVADFVADLLREGDQKGHGALLIPGNRFEKRLEMRAGVSGSEKWIETSGLFRAIRKGPCLKACLEEKCEWIDGGQVGNQIHSDGKLCCFGWKERPCQVVRMWIELPIQETVGGVDFKRVAQNGSAAVRCGTQLDDLGPKGHSPFILVPRPMLQ